MSHHAAIGMHSSNSVLAVMDGDGKPVLRCRGPMSLLVCWPIWRRGELIDVALESTYNWYWLVDGLFDHGYVVHLVNTTVSAGHARGPVHDLAYAG